MSAIAKYYLHSKEVNVQIRKLMQLLEQHENRFEQSGADNWAMANDMSKVAADLKEITEFLTK